MDHNAIVPRNPLQHDLGVFWPPFFAKSVVLQIAAHEGAASFRPVGVDPAAFARFTVLAPFAGRFAKIGNPQNLATERAVSAGAVGCGSGCANRLLLVNGATLLTRARTTSTLGANVLRRKASIQQPISFALH
jgi:hypothetical protein